MTRKVYAREDVEPVDFRPLRARPSLVGRQFADLRVIHYAGIVGKESAWWCECACGRFSRVFESNLKSGSTTSCGCVNDSKWGRSLDRAAYLADAIRSETDQCINWPVIGSNGRAQLVQFEGVTDYAHRQVLKATIGPPPEPSHEAAHSCGNPACVNPRHLRWATHKENMEDSVKHKTSTKGERSGRSKLKESDVLEIRKRRADGESCQALAHDFGVSSACVYSVVRRINWGWLDDGQVGHDGERAA